MRCSSTSYMLYLPHCRSPAPGQLGSWVDLISQQLLSIACRCPTMMKVGGRDVSASFGNFVVGPPGRGERGRGGWPPWKVRQVSAMLVSKCLDNMLSELIAHLRGLDHFIYHKALSPQVLVQNQQLIARSLCTSERCFSCVSPGPRGSSPQAIRYPARFWR